jgi:hypothetical protein
MTDVTDSRSFIQVEEVDANSATSEGTLAKIAGAINHILHNASDFLGQVVQVGLTEAQFATLKGYDHTEPVTTRRWALMTGQSIAGSDYAILTGITTLPDATSNGGHFLGQAPTPTTGILNTETSRNKTIVHRTVDGGIGSHTGLIIKSFDGGSWNAIDASYGHAMDEATVTGEHSINRSAAASFDVNAGSTARPETIRVNTFIKIND